MHRRIELRAQHCRGRARVVIDRGSGAAAAAAALSGAAAAGCHIGCAHEPERGTKQPLGLRDRLTCTQSALDLHGAALGNAGHFHVHTVHTVSRGGVDGGSDEGRCRGRAVVGCSDEGRRVGRRAGTTRAGTAPVHVVQRSAPHAAPHATKHQGGGGARGGARGAVFCAAQRRTGAQADLDTPELTPSSRPARRRDRAQADLDTPERTPPLTPTQRARPTSRTLGQD